MKSLLFKYSCIASFFLLIGCSSNEYYYLEFKDLDDGWSKNESIKFNFLSKESNYRIKILLRNDKKYPFSNIHLISKIYLNDKTITDTLDLDFENKKNDIFKKNNLSLKNYSFILKDSISLNKDSVSVEFKHASRYSYKSAPVDNLKGLLSVGLIVEELN